MKVKSRSSDPVQGKDFLNKCFSTILWGNTRSLSADFYARIYGSQYQQVCGIQIWNIYPFLKHILSVFHFSWLLGCAISVDDQQIGFKGVHMDKMRKSYKNKGGGF